MKINIRKTIKDSKIIEAYGTIPKDVKGITQDSRLIKSGYIFIARSGGKSNGLNYINHAVIQGASLVITDQKLPADIPLPAMRVEDLHTVIVKITQAIYNDPTARLKLIGITGTNGKSTTVHLLKSIFENASEKCGMLSTLKYDTTVRNIPANLTTPDVDLLGSILGEMADADCKWAVMEVSSHALSQGRTDGLKFAAAGFSNLTQEHLDYHKNLEEYAAVKSRLFAGLNENSYAVINIDDPWGKIMFDACKGKILTYCSSDNKSDVGVTVLKHSLKGGYYHLDFSDNIVEISGSHEKTLDIYTPLIGEYHGENIALAAGIALCMGIKTVNIKAGIENLKSVPGRMEKVDKGQPFSVFVDYSHTPDALKNALVSLRKLSTKKLIVVFGCGGDRDKGKRPAMGMIASEIADQVIITNDNPRTEKAGTIAEEIMSGISRKGRRSSSVELDRRSAIRLALKDAVNGDIVLISGKGHETYQEVDGVRHNFDDRQVAAQELEKLGWDAEKTRGESN
ncbi:UDP-N-acetylmuramoyl-L-alanyl-D-glutamate--2,6-diaminopimelate ligase [bacterium]|nr:UDP-N-acetylmuramoyl-L-alanyl-D-glutamate--2,6-diaminopimelate ligase [bacterium]